MTDVGKVIFSFDFEIGWGDVTNGIWLKRQNEGVYKKLRAVLPKMLDIMDSHEIPAIWATVGAMIDRPQDRDFSHLTTFQRNIIDESLLCGRPETFDGRDLFLSLIHI